VRRYPAELDVIAAKSWYEIVLPPLTILVVVVVGVALLWLARARLGQLVSQIGLQRVSAFGVDVQFAERRAVEAYTQRKLGPPSSDERARIRDAVSSLAPLARQTRVLWVDDNPANNEVERATLVSWEVDVQAARSTKEAMRELEDKKLRFDLVISDWRRKEDGREETAEPPAGLELMREMKTLDEARRPRVIFYHGRIDDPDRLAKRRRRASEAGAVGTTGSPGELFRWTLLELARVALDSPTKYQRERRRGAERTPSEVGNGTRSP
jgi:CheY-like chemotaxis protein